MQEILKSDDEFERCGLVMRDGTIVEIENVAEDKAAGFEMPPEAVLPLLLTGEVASTWHTHPKGEANLSGEDYNFFLAWPDLSHIIIAPGGVTTYRVENGAVLKCS